MVRREILLALILFLFLCSCNPKSQAPDEMVFTVNHDLLGEEYSNQDLSFSFHPPIGWSDMTDYLADETSLIIDVNGQQTTSEILKLYGTEENKAICSLIDYTAYTLQKDFNIAVDDLITELSVGKNILKKGSYLYNGFTIRQITSKDDGMVNIRLLINRNDRDQIFLLDYLIDFNAYSDNLEAIESSIGSISII